MVLSELVDLVEFVEGTVILLLVGCSVLTLREFPADLGEAIASLESDLVFLISELAGVTALDEREFAVLPFPVDTLSSLPLLSAASYLSPNDVPFDPERLELRPLPDLPPPAAEPLCP